MIVKVDLCMMQSVEKSRAPISIIRALTLKCPLNIYKQLQKKTVESDFLSSLMYS